MADIFDIAGRINSTSQEKVVTTANQIKDEIQNKKQNVINADVARHETEIHGTGGINSRVTDLEAMEQIVIDGGDAQIATSSDFTNPDATKRAKIPTVGAIVDGLNDGVYDVSKRNPSAGPNSDGKFTLEYILNNANTLIPTGWRHGGMSISFVQSSDNKYIQARLMADSFTADVTQWQTVDDEPTVGSENLVKSGGLISNTDQSRELYGSNFRKYAKIAIIGDSISTFNGYIPNGWNPYYPTTNIKTVDETYWFSLASKLGINVSQIQNLSYGGSTVTTQYYPNYDFYKRSLMVDSDADLIIIALGTNDTDKESSVGEFDYDKEISNYDESIFTEAYLKGLRTIMANNASAKIVLATMSSANSMINRGNAIKTIAEHYSLVYFDSRAYYTGNVHPQTVAVMQAIADGLFDAINTSAYGIKTDIKTIGNNVTDLNNKTGHYFIDDIQIAVPKSDVSYTGNTSVQICIREGISYKITNNGPDGTNVTLGNSFTGNTKNLGSIASGGYKEIVSDGYYDRIYYYRSNPSHSFTIEVIKGLNNIVLEEKAKLSYVKSAFDDTTISRVQTLTPNTSGSQTISCQLYPNVRYRLVRVLGTPTSTTKYPYVKFNNTIVNVLNADKTEESSTLSVKNTVDFYVKEYANGFGVYFESTSDVYTITSLPADDRLAETNKVIANLQRSFASNTSVIANNVLKKVQFPGGLRMLNNGTVTEIAANNFEIAYNWKSSNASNVYLTYNLSTKTFAFNYSWDNFTNKLLVCNFYCSGSSDDNTCNMLGIISSVVDFRINNSSNNERYSGYYTGEKIDVSRHKYIERELFKLNSFSGTISNLTNISTQGFDIYDDRYLFQASSYSLADRGIIIADMNNKSILGSINMGGAVDFHFNNVNCGAKYDNADKFPLLYMSDDSYLKQCVVGRIADTADSITKVQTISYSGTHLANAQIDWTIDVDNKYIYAYGVVVNGSTSKESSTEILKFALPSLESSSIVLTDADIIDSAIYIGLRANQGAKVMNDKFYSPNGLYTDAYPSILQVVDMATKEIVSELSLNSVGEPEGIAFYNDVFVVNQASEINAKYMVYAT